MSDNMNKKSPVRQGDKLEHGGEVTGGSPWTTFMGMPLARKGDEATCTLHGPTFIDEGADKFPDHDNKPFALDGHRCACGCRLISLLPNVHVE
ncbi:PAAR domain-containing protein [Burkholderia sp. Bp9031]|uniref:PAAR domain-containing protein n=1 Tax=Burkholderia sp. Bp9031 TaxID=2184566 RepID=UPI003908B693